RPAFLDYLSSLSTRADHSSDPSGIWTMLVRSSGGFFPWSGCTADGRGPVWPGLALALVCVGRATAVLGPGNGGEEVGLDGCSGPSSLPSAEGAGVAACTVLVAG